LLVTSVGSIWRWAVTSNDRAVASARAAATECSRRRLERAEVEQLLTDVVRAADEASGEAATSHR
jgi:hypothetical protein